MENYNFTPENINEINLLKTTFFELLLRECVNLIDLEIIDIKFVSHSDKTFWDKLIQNHLEIRNDVRLARHFILKKKDKLYKELKNPLYLKDILDDLTDKIKNEYWKFMHTTFLFFEIGHKEKNDAIINTLTSELEKITDNVEDVVEVVEPEKKELVVKKKVKRNKNNDMLSKMMKDINKSNDPDIKKLLNMTSKMMDEMKNGANTTEPYDMSKMLKTFMPELNTTKNDGMMNDLMSDITTSMSGINNVDDVFSITKGLGEKYQKMISEGQAEPGEILGSLMGLMTDDKFSKELSNIDMSKLKPEDMLSKMVSQMSPEMMNSDMLSGIMGMTSGTDSNLNIGSLLSGLTGVAGTTNVDETVKTDDTPLTVEQLKEMEEFYSNISISADDNVD